MPVLHKNHPTRGGDQYGFSLVELIVAVGIFVTISTTFLFNYNSFDRRITIDILAHQIATWVHDAQVSAMSVKRAQNSTSAFPGYGLHFSVANAVEKGKFVFFADLDGDRRYDPLVAAEKCGDAGVECEKEITLLQGNTVSLLCTNVDASGLGALCPSTILFPTLGLDIVFARPNPYDATIYGDEAGPARPSHVEITVASPKGYKHVITVWTTGQVSVR